MKRQNVRLRPEIKKNLHPHQRSLGFACSKSHIDNDGKELYLLENNVIDFIVEYNNTATDKKINIQLI